MSALLLLSDSLQETTHKDEGNERQKPASFASTANGDSTNCGAEDKLKLAEQDSRNGSNRLSQNIKVHKVLEIANEAIALSVGE